MTVKVTNESIVRVTLTCNGQSESVNVTNGQFVIPAALVKDGAVIAVSIADSDEAK